MGKWSLRLVNVYDGKRRCSTQFPDPLLRKQFPIIVKAFDILNLNGEDVTDREWWKRKQLLKDLLGNSQIIQWVPHRHDIEQFFKEIRIKQEEGVILKDIHSRYQHERSYSWLKIKNWRFDNSCDVVGYTLGKNARSHFFGSLVLAKDGKYRGCVGSGFSDWELRQVKNILEDAKKIEKPFDIGEPYIAVKTDLKVKVKYYKITEKGNVMRFPVFVSVVE